MFLAAIAYVAFLPVIADTLKPLPERKTLIRTPMHGWESLYVEGT